MVKVTGLKSLTEKFKRLRTNTAPAARHGVGAGADIIVAEQKRLAPVKTGALRNSIDWTFGDPPQGARLGGGPRGENTTRATIYAGNNVIYYAPFVEFGTMARPAQPFFYPGYRIMRKRAKAAIAKSLKTAVQGKTLR